MKRLLAVMLTLLLCCSAACAEEGTPTVLKASGTSTVTLKADMAVLTFAVSATGETVAAAQEQAAATRQALYAALEAQGVDAADIHTLSGSVSAEYDYLYGKLDAGQELTGYCVDSSLSVVVRDADKLAALIDTAALNGAKNTFELTYTSSQTAAAYDQALAQAAQEAMRKAQVLADACGVSLVSMQALTEVPAAGATVAAEDGSLTVSATVEITYSVQ